MVDWMKLHPCWLLHCFSIILSFIMILTAYVNNVIMFWRNCCFIIIMFQIYFLFIFGSSCYSEIWTNILRIYCSYISSFCVLITFTCMFIFVFKAGVRNLSIILFWIWKLTSPVVIKYLFNIGQLLIWIVVKTVLKRIHIGYIIILI